MNKKLLLIPFIILLINSCKNQVQNEVVVYRNDFENNNLTGITGGVINPFNSTSILGQYNDSGFKLTINSLPEHSLITISFDLYIHDSWDGNKSTPDGPDIWRMLVDNNIFIDATFSNDACSGGGFCPPQSYPFNYPNNYNNPKTGAYRVDLPGVCHLVANSNGTSMYKITKTFKHANSTMILQCLDKLVQSNSPDPKCDESWSIDNIIVKAITL